MTGTEQRTVDLLPAPGAKLHGEGLLKAMMAASRADWQLDERERQLADDTSYMERAYLDELARRLQLPLGLKTELEKQAAAV